MLRIQIKHSKSKTVPGNHHTMHNQKQHDPKILNFLQGGYSHESLLFASVWNPLKNSYHTKTFHMKIKISIETAMSTVFCAIFWVMCNKLKQQNNVFWVTSWCE